MFLRRQELSHWFHMLFLVGTADCVPIPFRCFGSLAVREILISWERGLVLGKYLRECIECQYRRK